MMMLLCLYALLETPASLLELLFSNLVLQEPIRIWKVKLLATIALLDSPALTQEWKFPLLVLKAITAQLLHTL
jgi:hypothetical protein